MDPQEYAKEGVDKVYPEYNWMPSTGVQRGNIKSTPIRGDPQTPGYPSVGRNLTNAFYCCLSSQPPKKNQH